MDWTITVCTFEDLMYPGETRELIILPEYTNLVCPECNKQFSPPKYSYNGIVVCPYCNYFDYV
jgi:hypothetical protein